tara:strand:+ start:4101 stop:4289 length:189 start_codon:yes stop_codon:yes gene_type:complete
MFGKEVIKVSDKMFSVIRKVNIDHNPIIETWKDWLDVDTVFKKEPYYYFVNEITDIECEHYT